MAETKELELGSVRAAVAAGALGWRVSAGADVIEVSSWGGDSLRGLIGSWGFEEFALQFDGLHRRELLEALRGPGPGDEIDIVVLRATGDSVHFRGRRDGQGTAVGLLFVEGASHPPEDPLGIKAVFQPIVRLTDRKVVGFECLARLRRADGQLVSVEAAQPVAGIGPAVAREVVSLLKGLGPQGGACFVNLNVSARELGDPVAIAEIADVIGRSGCAPKQIRIEVTEQAAFRDWALAREGLGILREAGAGIVLDDFGAGHSSMIWLSELEVDGVKLDAALLQNLDTAKGMLIVKRLISLLAELGVEVVLEGVEDEEIVPTLIELGGVLAQGFALGEPVSASQIDAPGGAG